MGREARPTIFQIAPNAAHRFSLIRAQLVLSVVAGDVREQRACRSRPARLRAGRVMFRSLHQAVVSCPKYSKWQKTVKSHGSNEQKIMAERFPVVDIRTMHSIRKRKTAGYCAGGS
jgi:hypothetical protein